MKYRKKPVEVDAHQLTALNAVELAMICKGRCEYFATKPLTLAGIWIETLEGKMLAVEDDWIVKMPYSKNAHVFYPYKPDIFEETYEKVEEIKEDDTKLSGSDEVRKA